MIGCVNAAAPAPMFGDSEYAVNLGENKLVSGVRNCLWGSFQLVCRCLGLDLENQNLQL